MLEKTKCFIEKEIFQKRKKGKKMNLLKDEEVKRKIGKKGENTKQAKKKKAPPKKKYKAKGEKFLFK